MSVAIGATLQAEALPQSGRILFICAALAAIAFLLFHILMLLRPLTILRSELRQFDPKLLAATRGNDLSDMLFAFRSMRETIDSLQHRWIQRHPLTNLPTREYLFAEMSRDIAEGCGETLVGIIKFRDFDRIAGFDPVAADEALKLFAGRLANTIGSHRPLAQVDRAAFAIWFRGSPPPGATIELSAICYALGNEMSAGGQTIRPDVDASAATFPLDGTDPAIIVTRSLLSLDESGHGGDGKVHVLTPRSSTTARERFALEQDLRHAIDRGQLELHFQPVVDLSLGRLVAAEALIRWNHPEKGLLAPGCFIPILEDSDLVDDIGRWTLNAACRTARNWRAQGLSGFRMAVNLSARQLRNPRLIPTISRILEQHELAPTLLELELTETAAMEDAVRTFRMFGELRAMGISLAIDDFGSGYSSLSYVKNLPFDKLKIDREFVVNVHERPDSQAICRTLIELARGLRIRVLAEGVENAAEVETLQSMGCTLFQGFYFSEAVSEAAFIELALEPDWLKRAATRDSISQLTLEKRISA